MDNQTYFLIRGVLSCFPYKVDRNITSALNRHSLSKEITRKVLKDEIKKDKPDFYILAGGLVLQIEFLRSMPQIAFYEVVEIIDVFRYCFKQDKRITIKRFSRQAVLRLFACLYSEFINLPMHHEEDKEFIVEFRKFFSKKDMLEIINYDIFLSRFIFEELLIDVGAIYQRQMKIQKILDNFYQFPEVNL